MRALALGHSPDGQPLKGKVECFVLHPFIIADHFQQFHFRNARDRDCFKVLSLEVLKVLVGQSKVGEVLSSHDVDHMIHGFQDCLGEGSESPRKE